MCGSAFVPQDGEDALRQNLAPSFDGEQEEIPPPCRCPDCREQQRLSFRNERALYHRRCSRSGVDVISMYAPEAPFPVYANSLWWSDAWDPLSYGREIDFTRPFFPQYAEIAAQVPKAALNASNNENSDYVNYAMNCKDCYLILGWGERSEHCLYGKLVIDCRDCIDVTQAVGCELCYECVDVENCYHLFFSQNCKQCGDAYFLQNCIGCRDCCCCVNLHNKRHCLFNREYSRAEYETRSAELVSKLQTAEGRREVEESFAQFRETLPLKFYQGTNVEGGSGDYLRNCRNVWSSYNTVESEDGYYLHDCVEVKSCMDLSVAGKNTTEFSYNCVSYTGRSCAFVNLVWLSHDLLYCQECFHGTHDCFGCVGLVKRDLCILNTQYTRADYRRLRKRLIAHMRDTGEWGEFFPAALSPFGYNETMAQEYFPLDRAAAESRGFRWRAIPEQKSAAEGGDLMICAASGRPFRLVADEKLFYQREKIAAPSLHPDERHRRRLAQRNPRKLWERACDRCRVPLSTTIDPGRPEEVLCEPCFLSPLF
jgi:hypothetical protein